ncbi:armadillo repeat-containing protein 1-like [Dendronephthya gigantea]|uniref:armadillo repeat-containing protein 1-like n=1 Tax=Dendronephthya gigantea TaxID=151771 RepID=UPI00106D8CA3|nr:armadillo repeat-containing protein 1-like [Dendronephthya gigantea]XP_028412292.1 armadillo repeat-containing protein 1-like [Dendronephthya gigantea]
MEAIALVEHLKELSDNPQNRSTIVKDKGCLAGLVLFLDNNEARVVTTALQALKNLAQHKPNRSIMKNELGMLESLRAIMHRNGDARTKQLATDVYDALNQSQEQTSRRSSSTSSRQSTVLGSATRRSKTYIIQIKGLSNQITKRLCEEQLLTVRGMVSFTFDLAKSRCIVRARPETTAETICMAISKTKVLSAQQIVKNERGEEVTVSFKSGSQNKSSVQDNSANLPDYLPEEDEIPGSKTALARVKKNDDKENQGWFGSVGSFISKTLYW